jgi:hypothetical protein
MSVGLTSQCLTCRHFVSPLMARDRREPTCAAYPGGIPQPLLTNQADHRLPYQGDGGVRWESNGQAFPQSALPH